MTHTSTHCRIHPAYVRLRRRARAERAALVRALAIEIDWRYHSGPEWAGRYWDAFGDLGRTRACDVEQWRRVEAITDRRRLEPLPASETAAMRTLFRRLLAHMHPDVMPEAAHDQRAALWAQAQDAYRRGDFDALKQLEPRVDRRAFALGLQLSAPALRREQRRLRHMRGCADRRLAELSQIFPFCLRDRLDDADWIARQRLAWRQALAVAAPQRLSAHRHERVS